jgi:uncharacterized DUF497 family protein
MTIKITFDPAKRALTLLHRGLDFAEAYRIFAGRHMTVEDDRKDYGESRFISAGFLNDRMVVLVWTPREDTRRIISMRYAHEKEEDRWREQLG